MRAVSISRVLGIDYLASDGMDEVQWVFLIANHGLGNLAVDTVSNFLDCCYVAVYRLVHERICDVTQLVCAGLLARLVDGNVEHGSEGLRAFWTTNHFR